VDPRQARALPQSSLPVHQHGGSGLLSGDTERYRLASSRHTAQHHHVGRKWFRPLLLAAGAAGVLCTAWPVADDAAAVFCIRLYPELLDGADPATAAAATTRWLRQADVGQVRELVKDARAAAGGGGLAAARSFTAITERLPMRNQAAPFGSHQDWAAFVYVGV